MDQEDEVFPSGLWPHMDLDLDYGCRVVAQHITVPQSAKIVKGFSYDGIVIKRISIKDEKNVNIRSILTFNVRGTYSMR
jgi:hypothetical protein